MPPNLAPGENSLSGLQKALFSVCAHLVEKEREERERQRILLLTSALIPP